MSSCDRNIWNKEKTVRSPNSPFVYHHVHPYQYSLVLTALRQSCRDSQTCKRRWRSKSGCQRKLTTTKATRERVYASYIAGAPHYGLPPTSLSIKIGQIISHATRIYSLPKLSQLLISYSLWLSFTCMHARQGERNLRSLRTIHRRGLSERRGRRLQTRVQIDRPLGVKPARESRYDEPHA
jgi:hypothetical protein